MIKYQKLIKFIENNPAYSYKEEGNIIEIIFNTPSIQEAAESDDVSETGRNMHIMLRRNKNDEIEVIDAEIEGLNYHKKMSKEEIEWWLNTIDMMY
ncbi:hypothetical protein Calag_0411 [Caldisphaera lagunensis DSM 15908]|uniref:Uncharacterized protein n=1 Tax=Caldisphaera lagunensis (strain DSM 15908 / JCM 11604 / ANMR 0165 / IC-154) TaxID=1056495 RepID=L0AAX6_CALLD|nr:hypothetical protein [Caldisphaera lagunensis]AFZ70180.1 hypothetical protein Calag_0411 [Caldisphaera lagunensis DSM 15908]